MRDNSMAQALALIGQLGFAIACPMVAFIGGGAWLDGKLNTTPWLLFLGILLGVLAAAGALYKLSTGLTRKSGAASTDVPYKVEKGNDNSGTNRANKQKHNGR
jgi:F0F1-type ATP synthase assembly protein I